MTTIITTHAGAQPPASAPVIGVSAHEIKVAQIAGLQAWWRADVLYNPGVSGGFWRDRVNDVPLTLRNAQWPVLVANGKNGKPYLQFNRTAGTILQSPEAAGLWPLGPAPWTFAWIGQPSDNITAAANEGVFGNEQAGTGQAPSAIFYQGNDASKPIYVREAGSPITSTSTGYPAAASPNLVIARRDPGAGAGGRIQVYVDGAGAPLNGEGNPKNTNSRLLVGGNMAAGSNSMTNAAFGGRIYDLFVFHRAISALDREALLAYAQSHYGIAL